MLSACNPRWSAWGLHIDPVEAALHVLWQTLFQEMLCHKVCVGLDKHYAGVEI